MSVKRWIENNVDEEIIPSGDGREVHFDCPFCTDTRKRFYVKVYGDSGVCCCHNCGFTGNFTKFVRNYKRISYTEASEIAKSVTGHDFSVNPDDEDVQREGYGRAFVREFRNNLMAMMCRKPEEREPEKEPMPIPNESVPLTGKLPSRQNTPFNRGLRDQAKKVLESRGVCFSQMRDHHMRVAYDGKYKYRVIIPVINGDTNEFFVARSMYDWQKVKEYSPKSEGNQYKKSEVVFNLDNAAKTGKLIISEGIYDALSWGRSGISLLGKIMSKAQLKRIKEKRGEVKTIYVALDRDAKEYAVRLARQLSPYFKDVRVVDIPLIRGSAAQSDPNAYCLDKGCEALDELLERASPFDERFAFLFQLRGAFENSA